VIDDIRVEMPLKRVTHMIAAGADMRFAASQILERDFSVGHLELPRAAFVAFCDSVELQDDEALAERFHLPAASAETLVPSLMVYRTLLEETDLKSMVVSDATLRSGAILISRSRAAGWARTISSGTSSPVRTPSA
jgi:exopolyphosphatase/pppGpp-phosphohydrolase